MDDIINIGIPEEMYQIKLLVAIGLSKIKEVKEILNDALKKEDLSSLIKQIRKEVMH